MFQLIIYWANPDTTSLTLSFLDKESRQKVFSALCDYPVVSVHPINEGEPFYILYTAHIRHVVMP